MERISTVGLYNEIFKVDSIARQEGYIMYYGGACMDSEKIITGKIMIQLKNELEYQRLVHVLEGLRIKWVTNKPPSGYNPFILEDNPTKRLQPDGTSVFLTIFSTGKMSFGYYHLSEIITRMNQYKVYSVNDFLAMVCYIGKPNTVAKKKRVSLTDPKFLTKN